MKFALAALAAITSAASFGVAASQLAHATPTKKILSAAAAAERDSDPMINGSMTDAARYLGVSNPLLDGPTRSRRDTAMAAATVAASTHWDSALNGMLREVNRSRPAPTRLPAGR